MHIFILLGALMILYFIDTYLTLNTFRKKGYRIEENPILRDLLRDDFRKFLLFKVFDIIILTILVYWINMRNEIFAYILIGLCMLLYGYIDYKNFQVQL
jgi:hypothetical protein